MLIDALIILAYFAGILVVGLRSRSKGAEVDAEEYFLSSRSLGWPSIAISTIATNISAGHFMGMAGSAYLIGLGQANFEINAIVGVLIAAFVFVPLYLRARVTTITEYFEMRFGTRVALTYSILMMVLYAFLYLGSALFWGSYAIDALFGDLVSFLGPNKAVRLGIMVVGLGAFSAFYTYLGGLAAVVRTDIAQFVLLLVGGFLTLGVAISELGGWGELYAQTSHLMHLHLPASHPELPWIGLFGMLLLNLNYWGANQVILQRALAAKTLRDAQLGLLVGGTFKYLMVLIIIVPAIALAGITENALADTPDQAYMVMINTLLPTGLRGVILCGLFASLMSTVDSTFNSVSTLWSIDVYKRHLAPEATDAQVVAMGKKAILGTLVTGVIFGFFMIYVKLGNEDFPLTHWFNALSYVVKNAFVVLIVAAVFLFRPVVAKVPDAVPTEDGPSSNLVFGTMMLTIPLTAAVWWMPELANALLGVEIDPMNYLVRSMWVILVGCAIVALPTWKKLGFRFTVKIESSGKGVSRFAWALGASLVICHIVFH
jgi:SSS family solute:Na+ symporter